MSLSLSSVSWCTCTLALLLLLDILVCIFFYRRCPSHTFSSSSLKRFLLLSSKCRSLRFWLENFISQYWNNKHQTQETEVTYEPIQVLLIKWTPQPTHYGLSLPVCLTLSSFTLTKVSPLVLCVRGKAVYVLLVCLVLFGLFVCFDFVLLSFSPIFSFGVATYYNYFFPFCSLVWVIFPLFLF